MKRSSITLIAFLFLLTSNITAQNQSPDPLRYTETVEEISSHGFDFDSNKTTVVFTGSSSIKMWGDLEERFSSFNIVNAGFGGSHMNELLYWSDKLITKFRPDAVFIYEGDNDIAEGKSPELVISQTVELISNLKSSLTDTRYYLISVKPSPSRWQFKSEYETLNQRFKELASLSPEIEYVDVWTPMLTPDGSMVQQDIFLEDDLHMNNAGYDIWEAAIRPHIEQVF
jgi:lysophospholipase L1-like esterase